MDVEIPLAIGTYTFVLMSSSLTRSPESFETPIMPIDPVTRWDGVSRFLCWKGNRLGKASTPGNGYTE